MALLTPWFQPIDTDFGLLTSRIVREEVSDILNHLVCSNYVLLSQETNIDGNCFKTPLFSTFLKSSKSQVEGGVENRVLRFDEILCGDTRVLNSICDLQHIESENKQRKESTRGHLTDFTDCKCKCSNFLILVSYFMK